jgi:hypothetical protein
MKSPLRPKMTEGDAIKILQEMEERLDLLQVQVDGWSLWPLLRFDIVMEMVKLPLTTRTRFTRFQQLLIALRDLPVFFNIPRKKIVVKTYSSARSYEENGYSKDVFFDDLLDGCEQDFRIESINHKGMFLNRNKAKTRVDMTSLPIEITAGFLSLIPGICPDYSAVAGRLSSLLVKEFNLSTFSRKKILQKARFFYWGKRLYRWLLNRLGAEKVLTADPAEFLIAAAARELGLPVIEIQHGLVTSEYNTTYSWTAYARPYKKHMALSDKILLFGEHWKKELLRSNFWDDELKVTGRIILDSFRNSGLRKPHDTCRIVFTSQGLEPEKLITMVAEFLEEADAQSFNFHLWIKLHPVYDPDKKIYVNELGFSSNVTVLDADEEPSTFELLSSADMHWTISSSCHYDAIGMGVPTVILALQTYETVMSLHEDGHAFLASSGKELYKIVMKWKDYSVSKSVSGYFYRSGALENARKEIGLS